MKIFPVIFPLVLSLCTIDFGQESPRQYFNQTSPGVIPKVFAPGIVSIEDQTEFGSVFSKDRNKFYYAVEINGRAEIRMMRFESGLWHKSETILFHKEYSFNDPFLSPDNNRLFFISDRPLNGVGRKKDYDIWYIERTGRGWSQPINAGTNINSNKNEYYVSFTTAGKMYFSSNRADSRGENYDIYASGLIDGVFQPALKLGPEINSDFYEADVFIAPDESFIIFSVIHRDEINSGDLFVSFRMEDGQWQQRMSLGEPINSPSNDFCPYVTPDGRYLLYAREQDIYWVSINAIMRLRESK